jgi:phage replication O-like protein O
MPPVEKPNYTQIPNAILDNMASMSAAEFCVIAAICRQTFGWHKKTEKLSLTQLQEFTGMGRHAVMDALEAALEHGWITRKPAGQTFRYTVNVQEVAARNTRQLQEVVARKQHRSQNSTGAETAPVTGAETAPLAARNTRRLDAKTLEVAAAPKERKETIKESSTARAGENAHFAQRENAPAPAVAIWEEVLQRKANSQQQKAIAETVTDCKLWRDVLTQWALKGHSPTNIVDQLDVYAHGWQPKRNSNGHTPSPSLEVPASSYITPPILKERIR